MSGQTAKERQLRGAFTSQLLELLKEEGVDRLTYKDVVMRLPDLPLYALFCFFCQPSTTQLIIYLFQAKSTMRR